MHEEGKGKRVQRCFKQAGRQAGRQDGGMRREGEVEEAGGGRVYAGVGTSTKGGW